MPISRKNQAPANAFLTAIAHFGAFRRSKLDDSAMMAQSDRVSHDNLGDLADRFVAFFCRPHPRGAA